MVRVLHLIEVEPEAGGQCLQRLLRESVEGMPGIDHEILEVGGGPRRQRELPATRGRIGMMRTRLLGARAPFRRFVERWEYEVGEFDLVHAWGLRALQLATALDRPRRCLGTVDAARFSSQVVRSLHGLKSGGTVRLQLGCKGMQDLAEDAGLHAAGLDIRVPGVDASSLDETARSTWRDAWGVEDDTIVLGVLGDPPGWTNLRSMMGVPSRLALMGLDLRIMAHPATARFHETRDWAESMGMSGQVREEEAMCEPWKVLPALDGVLLPGSPGHSRDMFGMLPLAWSLASNHPILLGDGHPAGSMLKDHDSVFTGVDRNENDAVRWLLARLDSSGTSTSCPGLFVDMPAWIECLQSDYES